MHPRRLLLLIFALFLCVYGWFYNGGGGNQAARFNQTRAIVQRGTLYVEGMGFPSDDQIQINGHSYSSKAPGTSLLGVPPYAVFQGFNWIAGLKSAPALNIAAHLTTIVTVGVPSALMALALYLFLAGAGVSPPAALLGAMATGFGTIFFPYATMFFGHSLAAAFAFGSFYLLREAHVRRREGQHPGRRVWYAALLAGAAVITEYPLAIAAGLLSLYLVSTRPAKRELLDWALGGAVAVGVLAIYNLLAFGDPFALSYLNYEKSARNVFPVHGRGMGGVTAPRMDILARILWGEERGLLRFSPLMALAVPGLAWLFARRRDLWREGLVIVGMVTGFLAFNAGYGDSIRYWGGANSAGPRHLIPMLPFAGVAIGLLIGAAPWLFVWIVLPSIALGLMVTAVMPQVPMLFGEPFGQFIIPYFLNGRLAVHRGGLVSRELVTQDSIAYNWGKLFGLPGSWAMVPLYVIVAILLAVILREMYRRGQLGRAGAWGWGAISGLFLSTLAFGPMLWQRAEAAPLEGPGVLGVYYAGKQCKGRPVWIHREPDLSLYYNRDDVRPFPDVFCASLTSTLQVDQAGEYRIRMTGAEGELRIDGVPIVRNGKVNQAREYPVNLSAGPHLLEIEASVGLLSQHLEVRWRKPGVNSSGTLPANRLSVLPEAMPALPDNH